MTAEQAMCMEAQPGSAVIKTAHLKAIMIAISLLVGLGECVRGLTKCVVCKKLPPCLKSEVDRL